MDASKVKEDHVSTTPLEILDDRGGGVLKLRMAIVELLQELGVTRQDALEGSSASKELTRIHVVGDVQVLLFGAS
ncbi:MAG: hypothetical protein HY329_14565 [Chloroflexi bacterium]|nr:hypothetical protein [Chloroflexota bacterium]